MKRKVSKFPSVALSILSFASTFSFFIGFANYFDLQTQILKLFFILGSIFLAFFVLLSFAFEKRFDIKHRDVLLKMRLSKREIQFAHYYKYRNLNLFAVPKFACFSSLLLASSLYFGYQGFLSGAVFSLFSICLLFFLGLFKEGLHRNKEEAAALEKEIKFCNDGFKSSQELAKSLDKFSTRYRFKIIFGFLIFDLLGLIFALSLTKLGSGIWTFKKCINVYISILLILLGAFPSIEAIEEKKREENYFLYHFLP